MSFILYRIFYDENLVYLGRTKQPLKDRIRGHLFQKPMHRSINIDLVTKIDYAEFLSEADMNVYEIYFINLWKPVLNIDDKAKDGLNINLPDVTWTEFQTHLWDKWIQEIHAKDKRAERDAAAREASREMMREMRIKWHAGIITEDEYYTFKEKVWQ